MGTSEMVKRVGSVLSLIWLLVFASSCEYANTQVFLKLMNSPSSGTPPPRDSTKVRAARITFAAVADAYFDQAAVEKWLDAASSNPAPIMKLYQSVQQGKGRAGLEAFQRAVLEQVTRKRDGSLGVLGRSAWRLPPPAVCLERPTTSKDCSTDNPPPDCVRPKDACPDVPASGGTGALPTWPISLRDKAQNAVYTNVDEERFVSNMAAIAPSLATLKRVVFPPASDKDIQTGVVAGLQHVKRYLKARSWPRTRLRPRTALVLSGGAGTGAFEAGFVDRLLGVLEKCNKAGTCTGAAVDLTVGTSTGALVGYLVDMFYTGKRDQARRLLRDEYTCSVENDLYCAVSAPVWKLPSTVPGLMKFDGIRALLTKYWTPELSSNPMELVTISVDYDSGDIFADSDQDPDDAAGRTGRVDSVLASIVEPLMAHPVRVLHRANGRVIRGTFIDGGIRSGLAVMQAMRRGAERTVIISTSSIDPDPIRSPPDAVSIVLRTIDLMVEQPLVGEAQQADLAATARRMSEYDTCLWQYQTRGSSADQSEVDRFCKRKDMQAATVGPQGGISAWTTPGLINEVANSWQSSWVYRSEKPIPGMKGYQFDPAGMRKLYLEGLDTFQDRCREILPLFAIPNAVIDEECAPSRKAQLEKEENDLMKPLAACEAKKRAPRRICNSP